jgi:hypothetical protein
LSVIAFCSAWARVVTPIEKSMTKTPIKHMNHTDRFIKNPPLIVFCEAIIMEQTIYPILNFS